MNLSEEFASYWNEAARSAAVKFIGTSVGVPVNSTIKAYFKNNKDGGSYWLEIREPRSNIRLIDIEIQKEIKPITLRARIWYYSGERNLARKHKELRLLSLGDEEVGCSEVTPRKSWLTQLGDSGVSVDGVEYPLRKVSFLNNASDTSSAITAILIDLWRVSLQIEEGCVVGAKRLFPDEIGELESILFEGAVSQTNVNRFERNRKSRELCIAHYGAECQVCHINFGDKYGEIGEGFIHVHHVVKLSSIGKKYSVNPIQDLVPVCPNCHAMLHQHEPPLSIEDLRSHLRI
ncbi:HNH endonuclease [Shewanella oncorhynchi]|uniref:HNH endonuclease n=1 Tax=Shewanella oncorhynchi TaxID=2726434 RepID=UPI0039EF56E5